MGRPVGYNLKRIVNPQYQTDKIPLRKSTPTGTYLPIER
jgi:hypothetical protein